MVKKTIRHRYLLVRLFIRVVGAHTMSSDSRKLGVPHKQSKAQHVGPATRELPVSVARRHSKNEELDRSTAVVKRAHEKVLIFSLGAKANRPSRASIGPGARSKLNSFFGRKSTLCQHSKKTRHKTKAHKRRQTTVTSANAVTDKTYVVESTYLPIRNSVDDIKLARTCSIVFVLSYRPTNQPINNHN